MAAPLIQALLDRVHSLASLGEEQRLALYRASWRIVEDHPWTGVGLDNLLAVWRGYAPTDLPHDLVLARAHSEPLHVLVTTGVLGLSTWLAGAALLGRAALSAARTGEDSIAPAIASLAAFCAVVAPGFHVVPTASLAAICAGVLVAFERGRAS